MPIFFDIFLEISVICSFHVNCSSMCTPRNLDDDNLVMLSLSIVIVILQSKFSSIFLLEQNNIKFVFARLSDNLLALNHSPTSFNSAFIVLTNTSIDLFDMKTLVSSANMIK